LNPFGEPIGRLYVAGELGSIWGFLYLSGGNLAECFVSGRIAGERAPRQLRPASSLEQTQHNRRRTT
jgi:succinate dehydrogenase/fumarate reductase flavoprotein subunit